MKRQKNWPVFIIALLCLGLVGCKSEGADKHKENEKYETVSQQINSDDIHKSEITSTGEIDVSSYLEQFEKLVQLLDMELVDSWQFDGSNSYEKDKFYLEWKNNLFSMKNEGAGQIKLYGIGIGDDFTRMSDAISEAGWVKEYNNDDKYTYIALFNDKEYMLEIYVDKEGNVSLWYLNNWPEGEWVADAFEKLKIKNKLNRKKSLSDWKKAYIDYIVENKKGYEALNDTCMGFYTLVNIDNDNIPELYITYGSAADGDAVCSYYNGSVIEQKMYDGGFSYVEGENIFRDSGGRMDSYYDKVYRLEDGRFVLLCYGDYGALDNSNVGLDSEGNPIYNYYWNDKEVSSESEYKDLLNQVYDVGKEIRPYEWTKYYSETGQYTGNVLYGYEEIFDVIGNYTDIPG